MNKDYTEALGSLLELAFGGGSTARNDAALQSAMGLLEPVSGAASPPRNLSGTAEL